LLSVPRSPSSPTSSGAPRQCLDAPGGMRLGERLDGEKSKIQNRDASEERLPRGQQPQLRAGWWHSLERSETILATDTHTVGLEGAAQWTLRMPCPREMK